MRYRVIVGNIGEAFSSNNREFALKVYREWVRILEEEPKGTRGEYPVVLMGKSDEILAEQHEPSYGNALIRWARTHPSKCVNIVATIAQRLLLDDEFKPREDDTDLSGADFISEVCELLAAAGFEDQLKRPKNEPKGITSTSNASAVETAGAGE